MMKLAAIALVCTVLTSVLSDGKKEFVFPLKLGTVILMALSVMSYSKGKISSLLSLLSNSGLSVDASSVLMKGAAICILSSVCASLCRENGNISAADMLELSGRFLIVVLCLPLIENVIKTALSFI